MVILLENSRHMNLISRLYITFQIENHQFYSKLCRIHFRYAIVFHRIWEWNQIVISVTLSNMTSAAPLSVVLTLFSKGKEGKRGRGGGHAWKGYKDYFLTAVFHNFMISWVLEDSRTLNPKAAILIPPRRSNVVILRNFAHSIFIKFMIDVQILWWGPGWF